jgi:hypothetical protein
MGIIDSIKTSVAKSGSNKEKILYVRSDSKVRVRFLQEFGKGYQFTFHDSFEKGVNTICQEELGKTCPLCGEEGLRTRILYAWSIYNFDTKKVEIMLFAANNCTPVSSLLSMYENYGTIMDRDYVLSKSGKQQNTTYSVIPMDKEKFRNTKAKPYTKSAVLKILDKAFALPDEYAKDQDFDDIDEEDFDEEEVKKSKKKKFKELDEDMPGVDDKKKNKAKKNYMAIEDMEEFLDENDVDEDDFFEYHEVDSFEDFGKITKKKFMSYYNEYIEEMESEDDDDEDYEEDDE